MPIYTDHDIDELEKALASLNTELYYTTNPEERLQILGQRNRLYNMLTTLKGGEHNDDRRS